jgi:hypothetical protein
VIDMQNHTVAATIEMTNRVHPHSSPGSVAITPDGRCAYVIEPASHTISVIDVATQRATGKPMPMSGQPLVLGGFIGPNVIVPGDSSTSSLAIARDRDLTRLGFARFVPFSGGILRLKGRWSTARTIALLDRDPASRLGGGTIDTNGYSASVAGEVVGEGLLIKRGTGDLTLLGDCTNILGTLVIGGTLIVDGSHRGLITVAPGATLRGRGKVRDINLTAGTLSPGCNGIGILNAERVTMDSGTEFAVTLSSLTTDGGHGRLHVIWHDSSLSRHLARIADRNVSPPARIHVSHDRSVATHLEKPACTVKRIGSRGGSAAPCSWSSPASCGRQARDRWRWRKMACSTPPSASGG